MMEFSVRFTRWKDGERITSGPTLVRADDFNGAVTAAGYVLKGMRRADRNTDFEIISIDNRGFSGGKISEDMNDIWFVLDEEEL